MELITEIGKRLDAKMGLDAPTDMKIRVVVVSGTGARYSATWRGHEGGAGSGPESAARVRSFAA